MTIEAAKMLEQLPKFRDRWQHIRDEQNVSDIIEEVLNAHDSFTGQYDTICLHFDKGNDLDIANALYEFLKSNVRYKEESDKLQTTTTVSGLLTRGYGDCKHYAGFCNGVLDALNRKGRKIKWKYRFASYRLLDSTPHHVFSVINPGGNEIWIDPTPGADLMKPIWQIDKK